MASEISSLPDALYTVFPAACKICRNGVGNKVHRVREMMFGFRDEFRYLECNACGCLQLLDPPANLGRYYPSEYHAFRTNGRPNSLMQLVRHYLRKRRNQGFFEGAGWLARLLTHRYGYPQLRAFARIGPSRDARILDVGCGSGALLLDLKELGYKDLLGVDLFIPQTIDYGNGFRVLKGGLGDLAGTTWDVIMFHHSFEHIPHPDETLRLTASLLAPTGVCLIRIPITAWAWKHYGANWVQIDAPRHFFLHTEKGFRLLAEANGLRLARVEYDSTEFQFWGSELYARDIDLISGAKNPSLVFSRSDMKHFTRKAHQLNREGRGDQATFYLTHR